ncbi:class I SAM-dependent methyltransferase [Streptomyces sp. TRM S81-3]|uniref:Class I SAM-dependent methyltransferase n=1 Tax=Streptomyces griseicoloratus TaxID=2752516 RepID=A0A926QSC1_9ACTN|nr:class I SAM-dependent methyltransferase [Streptomyces griseicoloratus]MBD0421600.1 class I SAM-dependent methyltransferase [Streptomyces griseicoloratus]
MDADVWNEQVAQGYDESSAHMYAPDVLGPAVSFLERRAGRGPALEFAVGTGRVALPLSERGVRVAGIEKSEPMARELGRKPGGDDVALTIGDMTTSRVPGTFSLVYLVYNAITCLLSQQEQVACFRNAARHLQPGGRFVIEVFVPELQRLPPGETARPFHIGDRHVGFDTYDLVNQQLVSHHYTIVDGQGSTFLSPHRYVWPSELDLMAMLAGLDLSERWADWNEAPFTASSRSHVSVWQKPSHGSASP